MSDKVPVLTYSNAQETAVTKRWGNGTLKYGHVHEKFNFLELQELRPLRICQKHFETILPNFYLDKYEI